MRVLLPRADKHDGLPRLVAHGEGGPDLLVHRVELGQDDAVDLVRLACCVVRGVRLGEKQRREIRGWNPPCR